MFYPALPLARRLQQIAQPAIQRHPNLVRHAEGENSQLRIVETLRIQQGPRAERLDNIGTRWTELLEQLAVAAGHARGGGKHPLLKRRVVERVQEQLEFAGVPFDPGVECQRVFRRELRHFERQQGPSITDELLRTDPHHRKIQATRENRVELGDSAGPGVEVISGDTVDQLQASGIRAQASARPQGLGVSGSGHSTAAWRPPDDLTARLDGSRRLAIGAPRSPGPDLLP